MRFSRIPCVFLLLFGISDVVFGRQRQPPPPDPLLELSKILDQKNADLVLDPEADAVIVFGLRQSMAPIVASFIAQNLENSNLTAVQVQSESGSQIVVPGEEGSENASEENIRVFSSDNGQSNEVIPSNPVLFYVFPENPGRPNPNPGGNATARAVDSSGVNPEIIKNFFLKKTLDSMNRFQILLVADAGDFPEGAPVPVNNTCPAFGRGDVGPVCPPYRNQCFPVNGYCPMLPNKICPPVRNRCGGKRPTPIKNSCPLKNGKCPVVDPNNPECALKPFPAPNFCPAVEGRCPVIREECPYQRPSASSPTGENLARLIQQLVAFIPRLDGKIHAATSLIVTNVATPLNTPQEIQYQREMIFNSIRKLNMRDFITDPEDSRIALGIFSGLFDSSGDRIGIFPIPEATGQLSSLPNMVEAKKHLDNLVFSSSRFQDKIPDFQFRIPPWTFNEQTIEGIRLLGEKATGEIVQQTVNLCKYLREFFFAKLDVDIDFTVKNLVEIRDPVTLDLNKWIPISRFGVRVYANENLPPAKPSDYVKTVAAGLTETRVDFPVFSITRALRRSQSFDLLFEFIRSAPDNGLAGADSWSKPLRDNFTTPLDHRIKWLDFLMLTSAKLGTYDIQKNRERYNVADLNNWGKPTIASSNAPSTGIQCSRSNIDLCLDKLVSIQDAETLYNAGINRIRLLEAFRYDPSQQDRFLDPLNDLLRVTLREEVTCTFDEGEKAMVVRGNFVSLNSIVLQYWASTGNCWRSGSELEKLLIFATNTIYIDSDFPALRLKLNENGGFTLQIVAPTWEVIGGQQFIFDLNGKAAPALSSGKAAQAVDGVPGLSGKNGGNFVGVGQRLTGTGIFPRILANGGDGGVGQDGGDGRPGTAGVNADITTGLKTYFSGREAEHDMREAILNKGYRCSWQSNNDRPCPNAANLPRWNKCYHFTCEGKVGNPGFEGAKGGKGGLGGNPGKIVLPSFARLGNIATISSVPGRIGESGRGGAGGPGGPDGQGQYAMFRYQQAGASSEAYKLDTQYLVAPKGQGTSGPRGCNNCGSPPVPPPTPPPFFVKYLSAYRRTLLAKGLTNIYLRETSLAFISNLDQDSTLQGQRETLWPFYDFTSIELDYHQLKDLVDFEGQWESLLHAVYNATLRLPAGQAGKDYRKGFLYLYTAIYSRLFSRRASRTLESYIVVNMEVYLKQVVDNFQELKSNKEKLDKLEIVQKANDEYQKEITAKFTEANDFIEKTITPGIEKILDDIDDISDSLINEIQVLRNQTIKDLQALHKKEEELKRQQRLRVLFGAFKVVSTGLSFLGPQGAAAGGLMNSLTGIAESATMSGDNLLPTLTQIPSAISSGQTVLSLKFKKMSQKDIETYEAQLAHVSSVISGESTSSTPGAPPPPPADPSWTAIKDKVTSTQQKLDDLKQRINAGVSEFDEAGDLTSIDSFSNLNDLQTLYKESQAELNLALETQTKLERAKYEKEKSERNLKLVQKMETATAVMSAGLEVYSKYKNDEDKLKVIRGQITETQANLQQIEQKNIDVSYIMQPMLEGMRADLRETQAQMGGKSAIALEVGRWQVQSTLKELKKALREEFTAGFQADSKMIEAFENLQDGLTTLTNVYDRLQGYSEQAKLARFIATINSVQFSTVNVADGPLNMAIQTVDLVLKGNVVRQQYDLALKSFTTWMFPFAHFFLGEFSIPPNMTQFISPSGDGNSILEPITSLNEASNAQADLTNLVATTASRVTTLSSKLTQFQSTISDINSVLYTNIEFRDTQVTDPFFVWESRIFGSYIRDLLSGQEVLLVADVLKSPSDYEAVKFGRAELEFQSSNATLKSALSDYLNYFKVTLIHTGNSYYQYDRRIFLSTTRSVEIVYTFAKGPNGQPLDKNSNYDKLLSGIFSLSPYTLWRVKLEPAKAKQYPTVNLVPGYDQVKDFFHTFHLQLVGTGSKVDVGSKPGYTYEELQLSQYYNEDMTLE